MAYEQRDNGGALFKNDKDGNEQRPDYTGDCMVNGKLMRMAAWVKEGKKGKFMSLKFDEVEGQEAPNSGGGDNPGDTGGGDLDDEIPFISPYGIK